MRRRAGQEGELIAYVARDADPDVTETIKRTRQPYFVLQGNKHGETINAPALTAMFRQIIANNRAGGWRKLKRES